MEKSIPTNLMLIYFSIYLGITINEHGWVVGTSIYGNLHIGIYHVSYGSVAPHWLPLQMVLEMPMVAARFRHQWAIVRVPMDHLQQGSRADVCSVLPVHYL